MSKRDAITPAILRELLSYDPETGTLLWKERDVAWFQSSQRRTAAHICALWNSRYAGKRALHADKGGGYRHGIILRVHVSSHRVAWALAHGKWPEGEIDHIDGNPSNNGLANLRSCCHLTNSMNRRPHRKESGLPPGVKFYPGKTGRQYQARIRVNGKSTSLGYHDTASEAYRAYLAGAEKHGFSSRHGRGISVNPKLNDRLRRDQSPAVF